MKSLLVLSFVAALTHTACAQNQPPFSQRAALVQMIGFTKVSITYGRPIARGRTLFGPAAPAVQRYGRPWTPGADSASTFEVDQPVTFGGQRLAPGHYSIWTIPDSVEWTVMLSDQGHVFHTNYPGDSHNVVTIKVKPEKGPHMEALNYYVPEVDRDHAVLRIQWGELFLSIPIRNIEP